MPISLNQHKEGITKAIIARYSDERMPKTGFAGLFPTVTTSALDLAVEVERNRQLVAVDVLRCTEPNLNTFDRSMEKIYRPPFFDETFHLNACERYDVTFADGTPPTRQDAARMILTANTRLIAMRNKILRAISIQQAQVLQTGIVTMINGDNIDYKRQAASLKVLAGGDLWTAATGDPFKDLEEGARFIREQGLSGGNMMNVFMGRDTFTAFLNNDKIKDFGDFRRINRLTIGMPEFDESTGLAFQGQIAASDFIFNIWTNNDFFENSAGAKITYLDVNKLVMTPNDFVARQGFGGIPAIVRDVTNAEFPEFITNIESDFYTSNFIDQVKMAHVFRMNSAPLAIPVSIDRIFTIQTV